MSTPNPKKGPKNPGGAGGAEGPKSSGRVVRKTLRAAAESEGASAMKAAFLRATKSPLGKAVMGAGAAGIALPFLAGMTRSIKDDWGLGHQGIGTRRAASEWLDYQTTIRVAERAKRSKAERLKRLRDENVRRLMMTSPTLAAQVMAGQELPEGGVVIGGKPRVDLLQQLASRMSSGEFSGEETIR